MQSQKIFPYMNEELEINARVEDLLKRLTLDEKIKLIAGKDSWHTANIDRLGVKSFAVTDGPHGVRYKSAGNKQATYFPTSICMGATWNPDIANKFGVAIAEEVRAVGSHMILGPGMNIDRTPLNGRTFEYFTEDPYLNEKMAVPIIKGVQSQRIGACAKHYICNNQETKRTSYNANVSERALQELYMPAFKASVTEADVWAIMGAYNRINGTYACEHPKFLKDILFEEWKFDGFVVSDWGATRPIKKTENCINNNLCLEMGVPVRYKPRRVKSALKKGKITENKIDENLRTILKVMFRVGLFDNPETLPKGSINTPEHFAIARKIAEEGIVLLKNENNTLPLAKSNLKKIAIMGPNADKKHGFGGGSSEVNSIYEITPFEGIKESLEALEQQISIDLNPTNLAEYDAVIYCGGLNHDKYMDGENKDRKGFALPQNQIDEINQISGKNENIIAVLINGSPVEMQSWINSTPAILECWYPGMEGGRVIADILFGDLNPSGKLPLTFPKKLTDCPAHKSKRTYPGNKNVFYEEGIYVGYRYYDTKKVEPQFPFGHGLSYTTFEFSELSVKSNETEETGVKFNVSCKVKNTGSCSGKETVQLYIRNLQTDVDFAYQELKGFQKIELSPNESKMVNFKLSKDNFAYFDENKMAWNVLSGDYEIVIASSSRDHRLKQKISIQ